MSGERQFIRAAAWFLAVFLLLSGEKFCLPGMAAEKPDYTKAVTYFGDEWPINYWNSEDKNMDANFERIAEDGFNSIILVIPWREFQPGTMAEPFNEAAFDRLDEVMDGAERHGLWVSLRIGYCWDYYGTAELPARFTNIVKKGSADRKRWLEYSEKLYDRASAHENFLGGFITWEDFWENIYSMNREIPMAGRIRLASQSGYMDYLEDNYSLEWVGEHYGETFESFSEVYLPLGDHPSSALFYEYFDQFLMGLLRETQTVFPGLSMEVRADGDVIYDTEGSYSYYSHKATYPCEGAEYAALMYSVSMSQENTGNRISAAEALSAMSQNLERLYQGSGKPYFVEQLLYMDSTEAFSHNTQIYEDETGAFVERLAPVLGPYTCGYGLWVYRNYVDNCVYNSQFGLGTDGWDFSGQARVEEQNGSRMAALEKGGTISQRLDGRIPGSDTIYVDVYAEPRGNSAGMKVQLGDQEKSFQVREGRVYTMEFSGVGNGSISIQADKGLYVDEVRVYTYEQLGRIYGRDGEELDLAEAFRRLNQELE